MGKCWRNTRAVSALLLWVREVVSCMDKRKVTNLEIYQNEVISFLFPLL